MTNQSPHIQTCFRLSAAIRKKAVRQWQITHILKLTEVTIPANEYFLKEDSGVKSPSSKSTVFHTSIKRDQIIAITFHNHFNNICEPVWDLSEQGNHSILGWFIKDTSDTYHLHIAGKNGVRANPNSSYLFAHYINLQSINGLEYLNTQNVTTMQSMFSNCQKLTALNLSHFNTQNVTDMSNLFRNCSCLTHLDISSFDIRNVKYKELIFSEFVIHPTLMSDTPASSDSTVFKSRMKRSAVVEITFTTHFEHSSQEIWDVSQNQDGSVLAQAVPIEHNRYHLYIAGWCNLRMNPETAKIFHSGFRKIIAPSNCTGLFQSYTNLEKINNLDMLYVQDVTDMTSMFSCCYKLKELCLTSFHTPLVQNMTYMFYGCKSLTHLNLLSFNTEHVTSMMGMFDDCHNLTSLNLSSFHTQNVNDMHFMFSSCKNLTSLNLSHFNTENVNDMQAMFLGCEKLTHLDLSHFNTKNVEFMFRMFYKCQKLSEINLSSFNTENVISMSEMFYMCSSLTYLNLSHFRTAKVRSMEKMFAFCHKLKKLNIQNFDMTHVTNQKEMFDLCPLLTRLNAASQLKQKSNTP